MAFLGGASPSCTHSWIYDVFLSFHGEDTRNGFTDHLHAALKRKGIITFKDDEKLEQGKNISEELLKAIQKSQYAVVIISKRYAFSKWCLIELTKILESRTKFGMIVLPVFYYVDPSNVRKQAGSFAEAFITHSQNTEVDEEQCKMWKRALKDVGNLSGWHINDRHEAIVVEDISRKILNGVNRTSPHIFEGLVGIASRASKLLSLLSLGSNDVRFIGICGMGGIGKTTLARIIYNQVSFEFEERCFLADIREVTQKHGLVHPQTQLVYEILHESNIKIWNTHMGVELIAKSIRNTNVFIVLDDVDRKEQLEVLARSHAWFGQGSRIVVTSRDSHLLKMYVDIIYKIPELSKDESLELFSWKAFKKDHPKENYLKLSKDIVCYAQGLPLAIEVFGSYIFDRQMKAWKVAREQLKENLNKDILDNLQISYEGLGDSQKRLFLDIACMFNGQYDKKLECLNDYFTFDIEILRDKCLVKGSNRMFKMHDLLKKMGQQIVYHECSRDPGRCSRLWFHEDIISMLKYSKGTNAIEAIDLDLSRHNSKELLNFEEFSKMKKLRMLVIRNCHLVSWQGDSSNFMLSNELRYMNWLGYPLENLPTNFQANNLIVFKVPYSNIKQFGKWKVFDKVQCIDMSFSYNLIEIVDLSGIPNLKELDLQYCTNLSKVHPSLGFMKQLKTLDLEGCQCLKNLPKKISLKSLAYFNLVGCSRLTKFPNVVGNMASLQFLDLVGTNIKMLPLSFQSLSSLKCLNLCGCLRSRTFIEKNRGGYTAGDYIMGDPTHGLIKGFSATHVSGKFWWKRVETYERITVLDTKAKVLNLSSLRHAKFFLRFSSLKALDLSFLNLSDADIPNEFRCLSSIETLNLSGNKFTTIPISVSKLPKLLELHLSYCTKFQTLPESLLSHMSTLRVLNLSYCNLLDKMFPESLSCLSMIHTLSLIGNKFRRTPDLLQLTFLHNLYLSNCTQLEAIPKLPLSLILLELENCQSLDICYVKDVRGLIYPCTFMTIHIDCDGKPYMIPRESSCPRADGGLKLDGGTYHCKCSFVCSALVSKTPNWFKRNTNSFDISWGSDFGGCALLIHYQVHEPDTFRGERKTKKRKLDEHGNSSYKIFDDNDDGPPSFLCQFQNNELGINASLLLCAPEIPSSGPNAFWAYISPSWFSKAKTGLRYKQKACVDFLIQSCNLNVEVECWARAICCSSLDCILGRVGCEGCINCEGCVKCMGCANCVSSVDCELFVDCDGHTELAEAISDISPHALGFKTVLKLVVQKFFVGGHRRTGEKFLTEGIRPSCKE